jgi:general secretion pathway protein G
MIVRKQVSGFSIMEIMIAVAIIGIMGALVGPKLVSYLGRAKTSATISTLAGLKSAMLDYSSDMGHFPTKAEGGLNALMKLPKGDVAKKRWQGPYLDTKDGDLPLDGWSNEFVYASPPVKYKQFKNYEIYSLGENNDPDAKNDLFAGA